LLFSPGIGIFPAMNKLMLAAAVLVAGCQPKAANTGATTPSKPATAAAPAAAPAAPGSLEERLAHVEAQLAQNAEALDFLRKVYEQQKAQAKA